MKLAQLKALITKGESAQLEFKTSTGSISTGMQTLCAFLNSKNGGTIIFGVTDDGKIKGQDVSDKTLKEIAVELNKIEPYAKIDISYLPIEGNKQIIIFKTTSANNAPYSYDGRAYVRNQSTTMRMSKEEYIYLHNQNNQTLWESLTNNSCKLNDLDHHKIKETVRMAVFEKRLPESAASESIRDILQKLGLIIDGKITNAAVILFCKKDLLQFMQSNISLARFKGIDKTKFSDTKRFKGNAFDLYDKAMDFMTFYLPIAAHISENNPVRIENPTIPYRVLREALTNALVHRDYSNSGGSLSVAIYDNRINITNTGALPKGVELSQLSKEHPSIQRNPLIAHVFYLCGKIEKWGRGTLDMIKDCKKINAPTPIYAEIGGSFSITLPFKEPIRTITNQPIEEPNLNNLTNRQQKILNVLQQSPLTTQQILKKLRLTITDRTMQLELTKLKKINLIKSEGKTKSKIWYLCPINYEI